MIIGKDIRIGNYLKDRGDKVLRVDFIEYIEDGFSSKFGQKIFLGDQEVHPMTEYSDYAKPIKLTEEWLSKFGFSKDDFPGTYIRYKKGKIELIHDTKNDTFLVNNLNYIKVYVNYVHELQNLYAAITKKDLVIKA